MQNLREEAAIREELEANGGVLVERFTSVPQLGGRDCLKFRIFLR
jgi:hypothetical protein